MAGPACCRAGETGGCAATRRFAVEEALRWGEATVCLCPRGRMIWAAPLLDNQALRGGLVTSVTERTVFPDDTGRARLDVRAACRRLRELVEAENRTNAAYLAARREEYAHEQERAHLLHDLKTPVHGGVREVYLAEEPAVIAAIRRGDRAAAREHINRILLVIYHAGRGKLPLLKSLVMELVVSMCRTAAELGGDPEALLGANFDSIAELSTMRDEHALSQWLVRMLDRIMDAIRLHRHQPTAPVGLALRYMREHLDRDIGRDDAAAACSLSPAHFSRLFRAETGRTFTDVLNQLRVNRARELLAGSDLSLVEVALACGFEGQSYFTKVFRRYVGVPPGRYRGSEAGQPQTSDTKNNREAGGRTS
ncbi:MAG: helix-turn-helix domain-containing protein [Planctomycetota bacterium]